VVVVALDEQQRIGQHWLLKPTKKKILKVIDEHHHPLLHLATTSVLNTSSLDSDPKIVEEPMNNVANADREVYYYSPKHYNNKSQR
jgi:hypothetical protein